jgi:hypothetical protein
MADGDGPILYIRLQRTSLGSEAKSHSKGILCWCQLLSPCRSQRIRRFSFLIVLPRALHAWIRTCALSLSLQETGSWRTSPRCLGLRIAVRHCYEMMDHVLRLNWEEALQQWSRNTAGFWKGWFGPLIEWIWTSRYCPRLITCINGALLVYGAEREHPAPNAGNHTVHTDYSLDLGTESSGSIGEIGPAYLGVAL